MGKATPLVWLTTVLSVVGMAYVFYANVFPVPAYPFNVLPWIFLGLVLLASSGTSTCAATGPTS